MFKPRAYEVPIPERDPVSLYLLYKSKRPQEMLDTESPFFLATASKHPTAQEPWYKRQPVGINKLYGIMKTMMKEAGVQTDSKLTPYRYTYKLIKWIKALPAILWKQNLYLFANEFHYIFNLY